jgi:hypothetical protein
LQPKKHTFTKADTLKVVDLGYTIIKSSSLSFEKFLKTEFPDFNLLKLLEEVEATFTLTTKLSISRTIYYQDTPPKLRILYINDYTKDEEALILDREFAKSVKGVEINHSYCVIPETHRKKGLIKAVFKASLQEYVNMGAKKINVHAGLSGGGHVWARHGFVAIDPGEVKAILDDAQRHLKTAEFAPVKHIFDKYYKDYPGGKAFPMILWAKIDFMKDILRGSDWHGEVDLKNKEQFTNFMEYVFRK